MKKVSIIMENYFDRGYDLKIVKESVPLCPAQETWDIVSSPERLSRRFEFSERSRLIDFVREVMTHEDEINHHSMIRIEHLVVDIEVYTHDLNRVTNIDREFARMVDFIYKDTKDYVYQDETTPAIF